MRFTTNYLLSNLFLLFFFLVLGCEVIKGSGTANDGDFCHFPFLYGATMYYECITEGHDKPWCYTTALQNEWGECPEDSYLCGTRN